MDFILLAVIIVLLIGARPFIKKYNEHYIAREQTLSINGFFVLIVFMRHFQQYISFSEFDFIYMSFNNWLSQLIVVPFLFYSGYGIMTSVERKGDDYVTSLMTKRFPRLFLHFAMAVALFLITDLCMNKQYTIDKILLSFIGWESIGNSNWYIFDTLVLYILTFISFKLCKKDHNAVLVAMFVLTAGYISFMSVFKPGYWYNTCIMFPVGMIYAKVGERFFNVMKKSWIIYLVLFASSIILVMYCAAERSFFLYYEFFVIAFMMVVLLLTMKLKIGNPILKFLGKYVFEIYILQRIPMLILKEAAMDKYVYIGVCFAITLAASIVFRFLTDKTDRLFDRQKAVKSVDMSGDSSTP